LAAVELPLCDPATDRGCKLAASGWLVSLACIP